IISWLMLRAATNVISDVTAQSSVPSKHLVWQGTIQGLLSVVSDPKSQASLERLAEKLRYAASDVPGGTPHDSSIDDAVQGISDQLNADSAADVQGQISKIEMLMAQRDVVLRSSRKGF
ncbi:MAG: hypothetical protein PXX77_01925, partial [Gallionella sp.]|nr:hypothetical protein [Gallionella sp.]